MIILINNKLSICKILNYIGGILNVKYFEIIISTTK